MPTLCLILAGWFWTLTAATVATTVADVEVTQRCLRAGTCREGNPLLSTDRKKVYPIMLSLAAANSYIGYRMHRKQRKYWWVPQVAAISAHGAGIGLSLRYSW